MGLKDVTPGEKIGRAKGARFIKADSAKKTPGIEVAFEFEEPTTGSRESLNRVFWLSDDAKKRSMETLVDVLGCNGSEVTDSNGVFTDPNFLDYTREVKLVIELKNQQVKDPITGEYHDKIDEETGEVKTWPDIKWVNSIGGSHFAGVAPEVVKSELATIGFKGLFLAAKQTAGVSPTKPQQQSGPVNHAPGAQKKPLMF